MSLQPNSLQVIAAAAGYAFDAQLNVYVSSKINSTVSDRSTSNMAEVSHTTRLLDSLVKPFSACRVKSNLRWIWR